MKTKDEIKEEIIEPVCRMRIGQDSVTWYDEKGNVTMRVDSSNKVTTKPQVKQEQDEPKKWVGLMEEEIREILVKFYAYNPRLVSFAQEIQAKLKEKNT
jgi:hypothetical protein